MQEQVFAGEPLAEEPSKDLGEYLGILRRQKLAILLSIALLALITLGIAMGLPPVYRSTATILVQEQEIPQDLVRTTVTSYADERIQVISQQVMTRGVLLQLVEKYDLYGTRRRFQTSEDIVEQMRKDIQLKTVNADITDRRTGGRVQGTIAFRLSFDSRSPQRAQRVVNDLVSQYLNENAKVRQQRAADTSSFLGEEAERLNKQIQELESKLADFKTRNQGRLPELSQVNLQAIDRADSELVRIDRELSSLEDRRVYLEAQIAQLRASTSLMPAGAERASDPAERLRALQTMQASLSGVYAAEHPDLLRLRREIAGLQKELGIESPGQDPSAQVQLAEQRAQLAALRERYSEDHPDVQRLQRAVAALEDAQKRAPASAPSPRASPRIDNPLVITLRAQFEAATSEIKSLRAMRGEMAGRANAYQRRLEQMPEVERAYLDLTRDRENTITRYREVKAKQMQAEIAEELEKGRKGERFSLIDPANLPETPASPNRPMILIIGLVLSLGGGLGVGALREALDKSVRGVRDLGRALDVPVFGTIPYMETLADQAKRRGLVMVALAAFLVLAVGLVLFVHFFVMPLHVIYFMLDRRVSVL